VRSQRRRKPKVVFLTDAAAAALLACSLALLLLHINISFVRSHWKQQISAKLERYRMQKLDKRTLAQPWQGWHFQTSTQTPTSRLVPTWGWLLRDWRGEMGSHHSLLNAQTSPNIAQKTFKLVFCLFSPNYSNMNYQPLPLQCKQVSKIYTQHLKMELHATGPINHTKTIENWLLGKLREIELKNYRSKQKNTEVYVRCCPKLAHRHRQFCHYCDGRWQVACPPYQLYMTSTSHTCK